MTRFLKKAFKSGLFIFLFMSSVSADVKLRLYLKDGNLQSGNLVSETDSQFVLLTKNGREEIAKDKIMFVNGKPLQYWKQHPERNYQTEIIPTDVPNPAYVNDKAALPRVALTPAAPLPKLETVLPTPVKVVATPTPTPTVAPTPTPLPVQKAAVKITEPVEVKPTPIPDATPPVAPQKTAESKSADPVQIASDKSAARLVRAKLRAQKMSAAKKSAQPLSAFSREGMAAYFADRGNRYYEQGLRGRAIQDFHIAVVLNRQDVGSTLKLGQIYAEDGIRKWAEKYLKSPGLKKNKSALAALETLDDFEKQEERRRNFLFGGLAAGLISLIPALMLVRRIRRPAQTSARVISADDLSGMIEPQPGTFPEEAVEPSALLDPEPEPVLEAPVEKKVPPVLEPLKPAILPPVLETKPAPTPEPPMITEPLPVPTFLPKVEEPKFDPVPELVSAAPPDRTDRSMDDLIRSREDFLQVSRSVDDLVSKGHTYAAQGAFEKSRKTYRTALALHPQSLDAMLGLAYLCFIQENWELALEHYLHAAQINSKSADVHYGIGRVFLETGHEREAVEEFRLTLSLDPTFYEARETLSALGVAV